MILAPCNGLASGLRSGTVNVWLADLDEYIPFEPTLFSASEIERSRKFYKQIDRTRYLNGRSILRYILAYYENRPPEDLIIETGIFGKPRLVQAHNPRLEFNLSHSENTMLVGVSMDGPIGIDVEIHRHLPDAQDLVERFFHPEERIEYDALPTALKQRGFYNAWTRKEAFLKARGDGLHTPLDSFCVSLDPRTDCILRRCTGIDESPEEWTLSPIPLGTNATGSIAARARDVVLKVHKVKFSNNAPAFS